MQTNIDNENSLNLDSKEVRNSNNENNKKERVLTENEIKKSLNASTLDGAAYSVMAGIGDNYIPAYVIALNANNFIVGLATAVPQILSGLSQIVVKKLSNRINKRKEFVIGTAIMHAFFWFLIFVFSLFSEVNNEFHALVVVLLFGLALSFATMGNPVWASWMSDLVPENIRGTYFGKRNGIAMIALVVGILIGGVLLNYLEPLLFLRAFSVLFLLATISRIVSVLMLNEMYDVETYSVTSDLKLKELINSEKWKLGRNITIFIGLINFTTNIGAPYFSVYMLRDLKLDYLHFMGLTLAAQLTRFFSMPYWGKLCDKLGNKFILAATGLMVPVVPLLWLFSAQLEYLYLIQIFAGFVWGGFEIVAFNYVLSAAHKDKKVAFIALYNFFNYTMVFLGAVLGGILISLLDNVVIFLGSATLTIIFISGIARLIVYLLGIGLIENTSLDSLIREKELLIKVYAAYPIQGLIGQIEETFEHTFNTIRNGTEIISDLGDEIVENLDSQLKKIKRK